MIIRIWRGWASPGNPDAYPSHFVTDVAPELRQVAGFISADLLHRNIGPYVEFTVVTRWASTEAMTAFAGPDPERAVVEPGARAALDHFDEHVSIHQLILNETA